MIEHLTYAELAERLGVTAEAARALAKRLRLQRQRGNDGQGARRRRSRRRPAQGHARPVTGR